MGSKRTLVDVLLFPVLMVPLAITTTCSGQTSRTATNAPSGHGDYAQTSNDCLCNKLSPRQIHNPSAHSVPNHSFTRSPCVL
jgi:hypothetical protein